LSGQSSKIATRLFNHTAMKGEDVMKTSWEKWVEGIRNPEAEDSAISTVVEEKRNGVKIKVIDGHVGKTVSDHILKRQERSNSLPVNHWSIMRRSCPSERKQKKNRCCL